MGCRARTRNDEAGAHASHHPAAGTAQNGPAIDGAILRIGEDDSARSNARLWRAALSRDGDLVADLSPARNLYGHCRPVLFAPFRCEHRHARRRDASCTITPVVAMGYELAFGEVFKNTDLLLRG